MRATIADTSVFIARETGRPVDFRSIPDQVAVSVVTIGELQVGVLAAGGLDERLRRLDTLERALAFDPLPIDDRVALAWAGLRVTLRDGGRRMPVNDSWIAATAIAHDLAVVTQDDDYDGIPGLEVVHV